MSKKYKMNMTRPEFLSTFILDDPDERVYSFKELEELIPASHDLIYCTYCALMDADIAKRDIEFVNADNEENNVLIRLRNKEIAKRIKETCHKEKVRIGEKKYRLAIELKGSQVYVSVTLTNPEVLENTIIQTDQYSDPEDFEE